MDKASELRAYGLLPTKGASWRAGGKGTESKVKVTVLQQLPKAKQAAAESLDAFLAQQEAQEGRKADILILPENWLGASGKVDFASNPSLQLIADVAKNRSLYILSGTMKEIEGGRNYVTAVLFTPDGSIAGRYRKRKPTVEGSHHPGDQVGIYDTKFGRIAVMICFDVENADIFEETLSHNPLLILNPTWIPLPNVASTMPSVTTPSCSLTLPLLSAWRNALETMSRKFENLCIEREFCLVRSDMAYNFAAGTSQIITPQSTIYAATPKETHFSVFIESDRQRMMETHKTFTSLIQPPERERTERRDRTGSRYNVRSFDGHTGTVLDVRLVDPMMKALSCSEAGEIKLWNVNTHECLRDYKLADGKPVLALHHDDKHRSHFWSSSLTPRVSMWDLANGLELYILDDLSPVTNITRSCPALGEGVLGGTIDGIILHIDSRGYKEGMRFGKQGHLVKRMAILDECTVISAAGDAIMVWDVRKPNAPTQELVGHTNVVTDFTTNGNRLVSTSIDSTIRVWDASSGACICSTNHAHEGGATGLHVISDAFYVSVGADATMKLWTIGNDHDENDVLQTRLLHTFEESMEPLYGVRYNGRDRLFTFGDSRLWRMWKFTQDMHPLDLATKLRTT